VKKKTLILLPTAYPFKPGEYFLDDELRVISGQFEKIIIFTNKEEYKFNPKRYIPGNLEFIYVKSKTSFYTVFSVIRFALSLYFIKEFIRCLKIHSNIYFNAKVLLKELLLAEQTKKKTTDYIRLNNIEIKECVIYSYWLNYQALAAAHLKKKLPGLKCVSRAHSSDIYQERATKGIQPFKNYIINNLDATITISSFGKEYLEKHYAPIKKERIYTYRLGKENKNPIVEHTDQKTIIICSCSYINQIKRVHLIPEILSECKNQTLIKWIHFGDGNDIYKYRITEAINKYIPELHYEIKGSVTNDQIMQFYSDNYVELFINISSTEGIPVSIMEAISAGIPVIATNVGATNEIVNQDFGLLIESDFNKKKVANWIDNYIETNHKNKLRFRNNARNFWSANYSAAKNYSAFGKFIS
jgi:colanic acid/amylovoran biosynthesis glycosyltransferase